jgi:hypothetical protein
MNGSESFEIEGREKGPSGVEGPSAADWGKRPVGGTQAHSYERRAARYSAKGSKQQQ